MAGLAESGRWVNDAGEACWQDFCDTMGRGTIRTVSSASVARRPEGLKGLDDEEEEGVEVFRGRRGDEHVGEPLPDGPSHRQPWTQRGDAKP